MRPVLISVDFQKEFTVPAGLCYEPRPSVSFIKEVIVPFLRENDIKIAEIISDYRGSRPGDMRDICHPGEEGFVSEIPDDVKSDNIWIKCMNSPIWVRENIGDPNAKPGDPYQDPDAFSRWLETEVGKRGEVEIVLIGLTLCACILSVAQELKWRGFKVYILDKGTDVYSGDPDEKEYLLYNPPVTHWAESISWNEIKGRFGTRGLPKQH